MKKRLFILILSLTITIAAIIFSYLKVSAKNNAPMILKERNGTIALYKGNKIVKIYDEIVISVLPKKDQEAL